MGQKESVPIRLDEQGKWAEARNEGIEEGLNRHQQQYAETEERLRRLSDASQDE